MIIAVIICAICTFQARSIWSLPHAPVAINASDVTIIVSENTTVGTVIGTLIAEDEDGDDVTIRFPDYETESRALLEIRQTQTGPTVAYAELILKVKLDRDYNPDTRSLHFLLEDDSENNFQTTVAIDLIITDVNDEVPVFKNLPYRLDLKEDQANRSVVYTSIFAKDPDNGVGGLVSYYMEPITQSVKDAALFRATFQLDEISGHVTMLQSLDYEVIQIFQFQVTALDGGGRNSTEVLTIRVLDVQDTPPEFLGLPYVVTVTENIPVGTNFYTVRAFDGDRGVPNDVIYSFLEGPCSSLFSIDGVTGEVAVAGTVDRDDEEIMKYGGVCIMKLLVTEMYQNFPQLGATSSQTSLNIYVTDENDNRPSFNEDFYTAYFTEHGTAQMFINVTEMYQNFPQLGATSSQTSLNIYVTDENDNRPSFNEDFYTAYIQDTAQLNYPLQLENRTEIVIQDMDQGSSGILELMLRSQDGEISYDFEPIPSVVASLGRPLIALKSPDLLMLRDEITLTMYAIERDTVEAYTATATIVIRVLRDGTTPEPTTPIPTTTVTYIDPFIPSLFGAIIPFLLLVWAALFTCYYCLRRNYACNNKIAPMDTTVTKRPIDADHPSPRPLENQPSAPPRQMENHSTSRQTENQPNPKQMGNQSTPKQMENGLLPAAPMKHMPEPVQSSLEPTRHTEMNGIAGKPRSTKGRKNKNGTNTVIDVRPFHNASLPPIGSIGTSEA